jgi:hypothetical protein
MFESDAKKSLKNKYNKMVSISSNFGKHKLFKKNDLHSSGPLTANKSVYGELKLS